MHIQESDSTSTSLRSLLLLSRPTLKKKLYEDVSKSTTSLVLIRLKSWVQKLVCYSTKYSGSINQKNQTREVSTQLVDTEGSWAVGRHRRQLVGTEGSWSAN
jgi:hypothetical protein